MKQLLNGLLALVFVFFLYGCSEKTPEPATSSGVTKVESNVEVGSNGMTLEQSNIVKSYEVENKPGAIKHLYVISPYSGQVLIYSTVKGKVTSSLKNLYPSQLHNARGYVHGAYKVTVGNTEARTFETMNDSGTYGTSDAYLYWWDVQGRYHKHFVTGGQILHISDQPLAVKNVVINMELVDTKKAVE